MSKFLSNTSLEKALVVFTLGFLAYTTSWPAVVAFAAATLLYYMVQKREDQLVLLQNRMAHVQAVSENAHAQVKDNEATIRSLTQRLGNLESSIAVSNSLTTF